MDAAWGGGGGDEGGDGEVWGGVRKMRWVGALVRGGFEARGEGWVWC